MHPDDYALSAADLDEIFRSRVVDFLFHDVAPADDPLLILIGAQPGAGKTRAGEDVIAASGRAGAPIIGDELRMFHPAYDDLIQMSPADMPAATAQAVGGWVERSIDYAAEHRLSVLVEGTFRDPTTTIGTAQKFKDHGFTVQAVLIAVPPEVSRVSIATRYVADARNGGLARFTPIAAHNNAFKALPSTLSDIVKAGSPVDRVVIRSRDAELFSKDRRDNLTIRGARIIATIEWERSLTDEEYTRWIDLADESIDYLHSNFPDDPDVNELTHHLQYDRDFVNLSRTGGDITVRGHAKLTGGVVPHLRGRPKKT